MSDDEVPMAVTALPVETTQVGTLSEDQLKQISRHVKTYVPQSDAVEEDGIKNLLRTLEDVFAVAGSSKLNASHRVAAWNTLCAVIDQCVDSRIDPVRKIIWDSGVWDRAFSLYLDQSHEARPKSAKQLLGTLSACLHKSKLEADAKKTISSRLVKGVGTDGDQARMKASMQALSQFLAKNVLALEDVLVSVNGPPTDDDRSGYTGSLQVLLSTIFQSASRSDLGSVISQLTSVTLAKVNETGTGSDSVNGPEPGAKTASEPIWSKSLDHAIRAADLEIENLRNHIFPVLFKRSLGDYIAFVYRHGLQNMLSGRLQSTENDVVSTNLLYAALRTGREMGLVYETEDVQMSQTATAIFIPVRSIGQLLSQSSRTARLTGLSLLLTSHSATRPIPRSSFRLLRRHLNNFFADTDANFRSEVFSLIQRLMDRVRAITAVLSRAAELRNGSLDNSTFPPAASLLDHREYLDWLIKFLMWELRPTASYQRHISALKCLSIVTRSGVDDEVPRQYWTKSALGETNWPFHLSIMTSGLRRTLLDLLMDPFDDVRQTASAILSCIPSYTRSEEQYEIRQEMQRAINRAEQSMLATGRADQADAVAHLYTLLYRQGTDNLTNPTSDKSSQLPVLEHLVESLEHKIDMAKASLASAATKYPMHGLLTSIRYIVSGSSFAHEADYLHDRLVRCLQAVWEIVRPVLCNDAPEGYSLDENDEPDDASTKDTLSYCWRALKESSLLSGTLVLRNATDAAFATTLSNLCFVQLAELRHRGAFSTVAQTWISCCIRCADSRNEDGKPFLRGCYQRVLHILSSKATINTRRSAGIPSLMCGMLIADKSGELMPRAVMELASISEQPVDPDDTQEGSLPQVHAMNCIKDILKNTRLGEQSEQYIPSSLRLAADSLLLEAWAVRNCGLMLFRAAIDRLLGAPDANERDETASHQRISAQQYPELLQIVLDLVSLQLTNPGASGGEGVFPALHLLQRMLIPEERLEEVRSAVLSMTASRSWHVRDKAARTYAAIVDTERVCEEIKNLLHVELANQNALHGTLLCVRYLISMHKPVRGSMKSTRQDGCDNGMAKSNGDISAICASIAASAGHLYHDNQCPVTKAVYVDILVDSSRAAQNSIRKDYGFDVRYQLQLTLNAQQFTAADAILRSSLTRALAYELAGATDVPRSDKVLAVILDLARLDADACCCFFKEAWAQNPAEGSLSLPACALLLQASSDILKGRYPPKLKCEAQQALLDLNTRGFLGNNVELSQLFLKACTSASPPTSSPENQDYADSWLQLQAIVLEHRLRTTPPDGTRHIDDLTEWVDACVLAIRGRGLYSCEAAALAIGRAKYIWEFMEANEARQLCRLCLAVYDLLNDDDEDIRSSAAVSTSQILKLDPRTTSNGILEPSEASQSLVAFMIRRWPHDQALQHAAFERAFAISNSPPQAVSEQLQSHSKVDTALFAEEKQNLYIDEAREVRIWSQALLHVHPPSVSRSLIKRLAHWVSEGIEMLTSKATAEPDGALGWSTNADIFTLGLQVLYGAEILLHFVACGVRIPVQPSTLRLKLHNFVCEGRHRQMNELWMQEAERILTSGVLRHLDLCRRLFDSILPRSIQ